jgi:outer membrane protein assembly factor BamB
MTELQSRRAILAVVLASVTTGCAVPGRLRAPARAELDVHRLVEADLQVGLSVLPAVRPPTPRLLWTTSLAGWGRPAVRDDSVYALSRAREVVSLDKTTGTIRWRRPLPLANGEYSRFPMGSVVESTSTAVVVGDYDVLALDRRTGRLLWRFSPEDGYGPGLYLGVVTEGSVYSGSPGGRLHAIDLSNGRSRWSLPLTESRNTTVYQPIVDRGLVLAGFTVFDRPTRGGVIAVEARTGLERWRAQFPRPADAGERNTAWAGGPVTWNHLVVAAASTGSIYAFDWRDGSLVRSMASPQTRDVAQDFLPMVVLRDSLVVGSLTGLVVAYQLPSFQERWRYSPSEAGSVLFGMTADRNSVLVPYAGGRLVRLDLDNGRVRWTTQRESGVFAWPPAVDGRDVYTVGETSVTAFRREERR